MRLLGVDRAITAPHRAILTDERGQFISKVLQFRTHQADLERIYADFKVQLLDRTQNIYSAFHGEPKAKGHPSLRSGQDAEPSASMPRAIGAGASPALQPEAHFPNFANLALRESTTFPLRPHPYFWPVGHLRLPYMTSFPPPAPFWVWITCRFLWITPMLLWIIPQVLALPHKEFTPPRRNVSSRFSYRFPVFIHTFQKGYLCPRPH